MRGTRVAEAIAAVLALILVAFVAFLGFLYVQVVVFRISAVYLFALPLAIGTWYWLDRPLGFVETMVVATVVSAAVFGLLLPAESSLSLVWLLLFSQKMIAPTAFMLPLGAARTWRQRVGTIAVAGTPAASFLYYWLVVIPEQIPSTYGTPWPLVRTTAGRLLLFVVVGVPLFALGQHLTREDDPLRDSIGQANGSSTIE